MIDTLAAFQYIENTSPSLQYIENTSPSLYIENTSPLTPIHRKHLPHSNTSKTPLPHSNTSKTPLPHSNTSKTPLLTPIHRKHLSPSLQYIENTLRKQYNIKSFVVFIVICSRSFLILFFSLRSVNKVTEIDIYVEKLKFLLNT
ncbi:hypothetical protein CEXT_613591 [Caerostris extrusa]|uniref:Uncharacterized protein n=1 Tax=Caerostris extrusa TaxID=172846 RepID=A0AAV4Y238_CAEEX|nr:hypothetical protein CEXT_613591 [Caerostris extrusa]